MKDLIEALNIFLKYQDEHWPTRCEHDVLCVVGITEEEVSEDDKRRLNELGFFFLEDAAGEPGWGSFRFGIA